MKTPAMQKTIIIEEWCDEYHTVRIESEDGHVFFEQRKDNFVRTHDNTFVDVFLKNLSRKSSNTGNDIVGNSRYFLQTRPYGGFKIFDFKHKFLCFLEKYLLKQRISASVEKLKSVEKNDYV